MALNKDFYPKEQLALNPNIDPNAVFGAPITGDSLTPITPTNFQTPSLSVVPSISGIDTTLPATPKTEEASELTTRIQKMNEALTGRTAFTQEQEKAQGLPEQQKAFTDITAQIKGLQLQSQDLQNQYNVLIPERMQQQAQGRGITTGGLAPLTASEQRKNLLQQGTIASQALTLQASFEAMKGNIANSQMLVDRAVAAKYGPQEEAIKINMANLELLLKDPKIDKETKDRANAQLAIQKTKEAEIAKAKSNTEEALKIANTAAQNAQNFIPTAQYPSVAVALNAIGKADPISALQIATATGLVQKQEKVTGDIGEFESAKAKGLIPQTMGYFEYIRQKGVAGRAPTGDGITAGGDLDAYASQYSDTGKLPSPAELKLSGLNVGQVTAMAKQMPKPDGALVSTNTGTKSSALSPTQEAGIIALNEIVNQTLPALKDRFGKINAGVIGRIGAAFFTTQNRQDYRTFRAEFMSKLLLARSGAAVTEQEYSRLATLMPSELGNKFLGGISDKGGKALSSLETSMKNTLDNLLASQQLSIYGYSKVKMGGVERTVGETLEIGGVKYRVLPDGNLTDIL